ncbi:MAG: diacylglycerol kinase family lipid kinase [Armatimonadetes bacterium]|nr:diacylglycerol kinase family lipid kinase [Armatimonadota bacterium]
MRCALIVNPVAKKGRALLSAQRAQKRLNEHGWECELMVSESGEHIRQLTDQAVAKNYNAVIVAGGDGSIHHAVQVLAKTEIPLGIIPCGRGNDLVRTLKIPFSPEEAASVIAQGRIKKIDLGRISASNFPEPRYYCGIVTCGFDSEVAAFVHQNRNIPGGWFGYLGAALILLAQFKFPEIRIQAEGLDFGGQILLAATANCPAYGGGLWIAPTAQIDDGLLNVCVVRRTSKIRILLLMPTVFTGKHILEPEVSLHAVKSVRLESPMPLNLFADGEPVGTTPAEIKIEPNSLSVFVPSEI